MTLINKAVGCLIGSAYGDSLGAAVEFLTLDEIRRKYGNDGINKLMPIFRLPAGTITDDTQMAIATAKGLVNSNNLFSYDQVIKSIWQEYLVWYDSQSNPQESRAPGNTCLSALASGRMGTIDLTLNGSAGCGAIMRAHPIGIVSNNLEYTFELGMASGAITHGNPNGYVPAGFLAMLIAELINGKDLETAIAQIASFVEKMPNKRGAGTFEVVHRALLAPRSGDFGHIIDDKIGGGGGWRGHDALAISIYAVLCSPQDPLRAVEIAVNHSGDSDSTGAIAGAIMGTIFGPEAFDVALKNQGVMLEHDRLLRDLGILLIKLREKD